MRGDRSIARQLERQCRATMAMLPYASVGGLGSLDIEVLAQIFGQTMYVRNELPDMARFAVDELHKIEMQRLGSVETQREYWRRKKREERARRRVSHSTI